MLDDAPVLVAIILDLTERTAAAEQLRRIEERARESEQLASIGTLAAGLAHDIGTPMNVILGYAEMLRKSATRDQDRQRARLIVEQVRRIGALIQTLLNVVGGDGNLLFNVGPGGAQQRLVGIRAIQPHLFENGARGGSLAPA